MLALHDVVGVVLFRVLHRLLRRDLLLYGHEVAVDRVVRGQVLVDGRPHAVDEGRVGDQVHDGVGVRARLDV